MKIRKFILAPSVALAVIAVASAALWTGKDQPGDVAVRSGMVQAKRDKLARSILVSGELVPVRAVRVTVPRFRERGSVPIQAMAHEGVLVRPGDMLLDIDNARLIDGLNAEKINLEGAENDLAKKRSEADIQIKDLEIEFAARKLDLEKAALKAEIPRHLLPLRDWQDYQFALEKAKKEFDDAARRLELTRKAAAEELALLEVKRDQTQTRIKAIEADLSALEIVAATTGTVLYEKAPATWNSNPNDPPRKFQVGDQVSPGMIIMSVVDLTEMEVRAFISEVDGGVVRSEQRVRVTLDSYPGREMSGTVGHIPEVAERLRRLSNVRVFVGSIKLDQTDLALMKPGMSARDLKQYQIELEQAEQEYRLLTQKLESTGRMSKSKLLVLENNLANIRLRVEKSESLKKACFVKAPIAGTLTYRMLADNVKRKVGEQTCHHEIILQIPDLSTLRLEGMVEESYAGHLRVGQPVRVRVDALPDAKLTGKIISVGSVLRTRRADTPVKGADMVIALDEKVGKMSSGMTATGQIEVERAENVLLVPIKAVREKDGRATVNVLNPEGHAEAREVRVGRRNQQVVEVIEGVREGERLVVE